MERAFGGPLFFCFAFDHNRAGVVEAIGVATFPAPAIRGDLLPVIPGSPIADFGARWGVLGMFAAGRLLVAWDASSVLRTLERELAGNPSALAWRRIYEVRSLATQTWPELKFAGLEELAQARGVEMKDPRAHGRAMATLEIFSQIAEAWDEEPPEWGVSG